MPAPSSRRPRALVVASALVVAGACGSSAERAAACGPVTRERLDPAYLVHVLGDRPGTRYLSDPPTSGPHQSGPAVEGVVRAPIPRPVQVGILERGDILLQHDPALRGADLSALEGLAGEGVVVAPNADLPDRVVATAWTYKQRCRAVDVGALSAFVRARAGKGPDG